MVHVNIKVVFNDISAAGDIGTDNQLSFCAPGKKIFSYIAHFVICFSEPEF